MDGEALLAYVEQMLVPDLKRGDIVVMETSSPTRSPASRLIEKMFAKLKAHLRKVKARTYDALFEEIGKLIRSLTLTKCRNFI